MTFLRVRNTCGRIIILLQNIVTGPSDYCDHEQFQAKCDNKETILMQSAQFGRMRVGRCIDIDYRIGCSMDVVPIMDGFCSGQSACEVHVGHPRLLSAKFAANVCKSLLAYLSASYSCLKGWCY